MDILSDVLRVVRLSGSVFFTAELSAPWAFDSPNPDLLASVVMPDAECVVLFHILIDGECFVKIPRGACIRLSAGDVIILPHGDSHSMCSHDRTDPIPITSVLTHAAPDALPQVAFGGGGSQSHFICGYLNCDQRFNPLVTALPAVLVVRSGDGYGAVEAIDAEGTHSSGVSEGSGSWLSTTLKFTIHEAKSGRPGNRTMLGRLTELMFVEILRQYMEQIPPEEKGWLAGLKDPHIGLALRLMHSQPARNWTVDELAHEVGLSRSVLAQRFTGILGSSPMRYLATWRFQVAKQMLREGKCTIPEIAGRVGYESEAAFNRAFKRAAGFPPAAWRKGAAPDTRAQSASGGLP